MSRKSRFNGSFYPSQKKEILQFIEAALRDAKVDAGPGSPFSYVAPHAGYAYSGKTAAYTYKALSKNPRMSKVETIVVVGPNHTGMGKPIAVSPDDWETPIGISLNDRELSKRIAEGSDYISMDGLAHANEHSIEVQLPFLQHLFPKKKLVFICMGDQRVGASELLSNAIIKASDELKRGIMIIASSDFNHYESAEVAERKDSRLLDAARALDYKGFNRLVEELEDSACGFGPISVAMLFAMRMGGRRGVVLKYTNSGESTGDYSSVVAYASIAFI